MPANAQWSKYQLASRLLQVAAGHPDAGNGDGNIPDTVPAARQPGEVLEQALRLAPASSSRARAALVREARQQDNSPAFDSEDCTCPICLELLLRPVKLSCGHCFCRGCWTHVLQGRAARATAHLTGTAACPYRCEVKPLVPEIDQTLASQLESQFAEEYKKRASATSLPNEERRSASVNEWAAQGCKLDARELAKQAEDAATAQAATVQARTESRLRNMIIDVSVVGAVLLFALLVLLLMTAAHPTFASTHPG